MREEAAQRSVISQQGCGEKNACNTRRPGHVSVIAKTIVLSVKANATTRVASALTPTIAHGSLGIVSTIVNLQRKMWLAANMN